MIRSKKRKDAWEEAALEKIRLLEHQLRRTQDTAVSLENVAAKYRDENKRLKELVESLRWRIFTLLKSTNVDAEIFGLPKYKIDPEREYDDEETAEAFFRELERLSERYHVETEVVDDGGLTAGEEDVEL